MNRRGQLIGALLLLALGLFFTVKAYMIPTPVLQQDVNTTPSFFPFLVGAAFCGLALLNLIMSVRRPDKTPISKGSRTTSRRRWMAAATLAVILSFIVFMQVIGWLLSSFIMMSLIIVFTAKAMQRRFFPWRVLIISALFSVALFVLFDYLLGVPLPVGPWSPETLLIGK